MMANGNFGGGNGTANNPYLVEDAYDLDAVRHNATAHYFQTQDIDLSIFENWMAIGNISNSQEGGFFYFEGGYNGNNKIISNLTNTNVRRSEYGLFSNMHGATIKNIILTNVNIKGEIFNKPGVHHEYAYGCLVGEVWISNIINCHASGKINGLQVAGGLIGESTGGRIVECSFNGEISTTHVIENWVDVCGAGGLIGKVAFTDIENCYASGVIVDNRYHKYCGGLIGRISLSDLVSNEIKNCYSVIAITSPNIESSGLIGNTQRKAGVSNIEAEISNCYYNKDIISVPHNGYGTPKSTEEMKLKNTYENWRFEGDFEAIWTIRETEDYPRFINFIALRFLSKNSIGEKIDFNYWQTTILIDSRPYQNFNYFKNDNERSIYVWIRKSNVHVKVTAKKIGFEIPGWDMDVTENEEIVITAQPYDYSQQPTYYLSTPQDFLNMSDPFGNYVLTNDIDFEGIDYITPFSQEPFLGNLDSKNKVIKNLTVKSNINGDYNGVGIIGYAINATFKNVVIETSTLTDSARSFNVPAAFICGKLEQKIIDEYQPTKNRLITMSNCRIDDSELNYDNATYAITGVFVGEVETQPGALDALDLSDYTMFTKFRSHNIVCNLNGGHYMGGLLGKVRIVTNTDDELTIADDIELYTTIDFNNTDCVWVSGMFAEAIFNANVKFHKVGTNTTIKNVIVNFATGGLFGQSIFNRDLVKIENWYADTILDNVTINSGFGGLTGVWQQASSANNITLDKGYIATNTDIASNPSQGIGVFYGHTDMVNPIAFENVFIDKDINAMVTNDEPPTMLKTTSQMQSRSTFTNFDFTKIWVIEAGKYPKFVLRKERVVKLCQRMPLTNFRSK